MRPMVATPSYNADVVDWAVDANCATMELTYVGFSIYQCVVSRAFSSYLRSI